MPRIQIPNPETGRMVYLDTPKGKKLLDLFRTSSEARKILKQYLKDNAQEYK